MTIIDPLPTVYDRDHEPGDRPPAPGPLAHVQSFVNTVDLEDGREDFATPAQLVDWLLRHGLLDESIAADEADLRRAIALREAIRSLLVTNASGAVDSAAWSLLNRQVETAALRVTFSPEIGAVVRPKSGGIDGALGRLVAIIFAAMTDGTWERLKACRYDVCRWAFFDASKNQSAHWCAMAICGNKAKTRSYRSRRRGANASESS